MKKLKCQFFGTVPYARIRAGETSARRALVTFYREPKQYTIIRKNGFRAWNQPVGWQNSISFDLWLFQIAFSWQSGKVYN